MFPKELAEVEVRGQPVRARFRVDAAGQAYDIELQDNKGRRLLRFESQLSDEEVDGLAFLLDAYWVFRKPDPNASVAQPRRRRAF